MDSVHFADRHFMSGFAVTVQGTSLLSGAKDDFKVVLYVIGGDL